MAENFPDLEHRGTTMTISLKCDTVDYARLQHEAKPQGFTQSRVLHNLIEFMRLRLECERRKGSELGKAIDQFSPDRTNELEAFDWVVAVDSGLVSLEEMQSAAWHRQEMRPHTLFGERAPELGELLSRRFRERYGEMDIVDASMHEFQPVADEHPAALRAFVEMAEKAEKAK